MKKLFLTSSFKDVAPIFQNEFKDEIEGKTVTFIPTASLTEEVTFYVSSARKAFEEMGMIVDELEISSATNDEIKKKLTSNDYIYISGGNTFYLLQELKKSGADKLIIELISNGKLYIGESAGSMVISPNIEYVELMDKRSVAEELSSTEGMNIIDIYPVPHYTEFPFKKSVEKVINEYDEKLALYPITNHQAIMCIDEEISVLED